MVWLGPLQKSSDSEAPEVQACSLRAFMDRELTGICSVSGDSTEKLEFLGFRAPGLQLEGFLGQGVNQ